MADTRPWAPIIILAVILAGAFCLYYLDKVDTASAKLETAHLQFKQGQARLQSSQRMIASRTALATNNQAVKIRLQLAVDRVSRAEKKNDAAEAKGVEIESGLKYLFQIVKAAAEKARGQAIKDELPELRLRSGSILKGVRFRKFADGVCSLVHSAGIGTVAYADLPVDMVEELQLGPDCLLDRLENLGVVTGLAPRPVVAGGSENDKQLAAIRRRIADLETRIQQAAAFSIKLENEVRDYDSSILSEQSKGNPTFNLRTLRDVAEGNAGMARVELGKLETDLKKLRQQELAEMNR